jgi:hypothetical protein
MKTANKKAWKGKFRKEEKLNKKQQLKVSNWYLTVLFKMK